MKIINKAALVAGALFCLNSWAFSQTISLNMKDVTVKEAMEQLKKTSGYSFVFSSVDVNTDKHISISVADGAIEKIVDQIMEGQTGLEYEIQGKKIIVKRKHSSVERVKKTIKITGKVIDAKGEPVIGATIKEEGTNNGTITDFDGNFSFEASEGGNLEVSYIGYKSILLASKPSLGQIVMKEDTEVLDEVVVTALGIKRAEKALSYNVQKVDNNDLTSVKDANFVNSLNGKVAGVSIQRSSSGVGGSTRVVMRGNKSIKGDNNVLYVVDGIPIGNQADREGDGTGFGGQTSGEGISNFNPDDIESLSVLTGPSAAALYGASAANGVILINTKKGGAGKVKVNVSSSAEFSNPFILPKFQNTYGNLDGEYMSWGKKQNNSSFEPKDFFETGTTFTESFNLSVGSDKNQTYVSGAAVNSKGIVVNNKYHRYNFMVRNTSKFLNDKLTLDVSASYVREYYNNMVSYGTYFNPIVGVYLYPRGLDFEQEKYFERYDSELGYNTQYWSPGDLGMNIQNPYWTAYRNLRPEVKDRYMFYGSLKYDVTDYLNIMARVRMDNTYTEKEDKRYASTIGTFAKPKGRYAYGNETFKQKYLDVMANFNKSFAEMYYATVNVGTSFEEYDTKGREYRGDLLTVPNKFTFDNIDPTTGTPKQTGGDSRRRNAAVFASAELSWNSALYLTLTGRADKPSQLVNSKDPWLLYPSVGLSALVTELLPENIRQAIAPTLGFLKVRASYTEVGSPIPYTGLTPGTLRHEMEGGVIKPYKYYPVSDLKGERTRSYELGLDSKWFDNTVSLGVTLYKSNTYNQLLEAQLSEGSGYDYMFVQAGNVANKGVELSLGYDQTFGNWAYSTSFTATANRNKIVELASNVKNPITGEMLDLSDIKVGRFRLREGGEIGEIYAEERVKRDEEGYVSYTPGQSLPTEVTEPYKLGSVNAKWNLGWRNSFSYKGFNLNFLLTARLGGIVISKTQATLDLYGVSKASADARDQGSMMLGNIAMTPKDYYATVSNLDAFYVYSATNVRLQEASLSYTFPNSWFKGTSFNNLILSVYGTNLWMIYNKAPYDPELTASTGTFGQGYDYFMLPSLRTYGVSLKFGF